MIQLVPVPGQDFKIAESRNPPDGLIAGQCRRKVIGAHMVLQAGHFRLIQGHIISFGHPHPAIEIVFPRLVIIVKNIDDRK